MITTNVKIAAIFITLLSFQLALASNGDLWFPKEFPEDKLVKCGIQNEMFGISIVDDYIFQFEKCAVIIYPPPLKNRLDHTGKQLKLENGYRFTFDELIPNWNPNFCDYAKTSITTPFFLLNRLKLPSNKLDNHVILYFLGLFDKKEPFKYYAYDFDDDHPYDQPTFTAEDDLYYILVSDGKEIYEVSNSMTQYRFSIIGDPVTKRAGIQYDTVCIHPTNQAGTYFMKRTDPKGCDDEIFNSTYLLLKPIHISFYAYGRIFMMSKQDNYVLITYSKILVQNNKEHDYPLTKKSLNDFLYCGNSQDLKVKRQKRSVVSKTNAGDAKYKYLTYLLPFMVIGFVILSYLL